MSKQNKAIEDRLKKLTGSVDPAKGKTKVTIDDVTKPKKADLEDLKPERKPYQAYKSVKLKVETYERLKKVIEQHQLDSIGRVIDHVLLEWCADHE